MISVLLVDDHELLRAGLRSRLETEKSITIVGEADSAERAVLMARSLQPDVILLDLAMPRRTGLEVLPELRVKAPDAKIIVFSGFSTASVSEGAIDLGAIRYLTKGADPEVINDAIEEVVAEAKQGAAGSVPSAVRRPTF